MSREFKHMMAVAPKDESKDGIERASGFKELV